MLRRLLLLAPMLSATLAACSPAEPPLLIDDGRAPAADVGQAPSGETPHTNDENEAISG